MRLSELCTSPVYFDIMEMMNRKFDSAPRWKRVGDVDVADASVDEAEVRVNLEPIVYYGVKGVNISFEVKDESVEYAQTAGTIQGSVKLASAIIGAVSNAVLDRLQEYEWSFVIFAAKDNIETRMKLYTRVADRIRRTRRHLGLYKFAGYVKGEGVVILGNSDAVEVMNRFEQEAADKA